MARTLLRLFSAICLVGAFLTPGVSQTKFYATGGFSSIYYHNKANSGLPSIPSLYYGVEVDRYLDYHYALTSGAFFLQGGYDNSVSRWTNQYIQVPIAIKAASLGDIMGISAGINLNYLLHSQLRELADTLGHYYTANVTPAMKKIQPDLFFGIIIRLNRITVQTRFAFAITNRYSTGVKEITDNIPKYYGSYYAYVLGKDQQKLAATTTLFTLAYRIF
jgi:hypothetical protein